MPHLSVKISEALYQQLQAKAKEMGHTLSDALRLLLEDILETPQTKAQAMLSKLFKK